ncbi:hypothetical protein [Parapedobacter lycopersici]|uniref:hypothetical protein n=1 Tax=Parapedobacter lycopersici TaxID=1864939 RepID=UPI00214D4535|nr:hypothetical protein [Parapedobacter lycopersici]
MARLQLKPSVIKKLFALSGNQCAFPGCDQHIVESSGIVIGEICHIEAAEQGGERFNKDSNDDYRRSFENLILLCPIHHKITNDVKKYPSPELRKYKSLHEEKFVREQLSVTDNIVDQAIHKYMEKHNKNEGSGTQFNNQAKHQIIGTQIGTQNIFQSSTQEKEFSFTEPMRSVNKSLKEKLDKLRDDATPPTEDVIDFQNNLFKGKTSKIYELPVKELKFRKENGRIKAEVESYEKINGLLDELSDATQDLLRGFLSKNDPEKKEVLKQQIKHKGQLQPAIITCDGFLINGNRRKMILEELYEEHHKNSKFEKMRVVILPENVSLFDIKRIENRYQLQDDGKSEYHGLNRALTIRENIKENYSLRAQLMDDPQYSDKAPQELNTIEKRFEKEYLLPLECVDRYLKTFNREGLYNTISESAGDKEGRWQAFIDYSNFYYSTLNNPTARIKFGIIESEIGLIENAIFKIIRKRNLKSTEIEKALGKVHAFVRGGNLKKYLGNDSAKKHLINIAKEVDEDIPESEKFDKEGNRYSEREIDEKWSNTTAVKKGVLGNLMKAYKAVNNHIERIKPLELLEDSLKKLNHENMKIDELGVENYKLALGFCRDISAKADELYELIDKERGKYNSLGKKAK